MNRAEMTAKMATVLGAVRDMPELPGVLPVVPLPPPVVLPGVPPVVLELPAGTTVAAPVASVL